MTILRYIRYLAPQNNLLVYLSILFQYYLPLIVVIYHIVITYLFFSNWKKMFDDLNNKFAKHCNLFGSCAKALMYYVSNLKFIRIISFRNQPNEWKISSFSYNYMATKPLVAYRSKMIEIILSISTLARIFLASLPYDSSYWNVWFIL